MSPLSVRRYRAERLLRHEFEGLRGRVLARVRGRLRVIGVSLDHSDLDACYGQAWQGLYMAVLEGQQIVSPESWLVLVTFRRAIEEHRARSRAHRGGEHRTGASGAPPHAAAQTASAGERDLAADLDDRMRLRQLFEGLRGRLDERERQAAGLCYLQGLSRSEAAVRMGVSEARMRKLMEGRGRGRLGVAGKVGALVEAIRDGDWCEEQGSLMRALAFGVLDPDGERYRLAVLHRGQCPACRAYVASLRGLAAALPPVFLPWGLGAGVLARAGEGIHLGGAARAGASGGRMPGAAVSASGAASAGGAAGGGWLIGAGPLGAKLAVGCLLALGVGAGCVALDRGEAASAHHHRRHVASRSAPSNAVGTPAADRPADLAAGARRLPSSLDRAPTGAPPLTAAGRASREFGPEQALAPTAGSAASASAGGRPPTARSAASVVQTSLAAAGPPSGGSSPGKASAGSQSASQRSSDDSAAAEREFSPG